MRRHDPDYFSLSAGLLFTVLGVALTVSALTQTMIDGRWLAPTILIFLGAGGVAASLAAARRQQAATSALAAAEADAGSQEDLLP